MIIQNDSFSENAAPKCVYFKRFAQAIQTTETHVHLLLKGQDVKRLSQYADTILHIPHLELKLIRDYKLLDVNILSKLTNLKSLELENITFKQLDALCPHLTHLEELILVNYAFTSLPEPFKDLQQLRVLDIQENNFYTIPNIIFNLTKLKKLNIHSNAINNIPDGISALTQLTDLCISSCNIEQLPDSIGQLKQLKTLDLSENQLKSLPKSMTELQHLESVNLSSNPLNIDDICSFLVELPQLKSLFLKSLRLKYLPDSFYRLQNLNCIDLSNNFLYLDTFFRAAHSFRKYASLDLQTHIEGESNGQVDPDDSDLSYYDESYLYKHPDIDLFDAIAAEKMIDYHYKKDESLNMLSRYHDDWTPANIGLKRMSFLTHIRLQNTKNFDYQGFIKLIQDLPIEKLELLDLHEGVDLTPLWSMKTLRYLNLSTKNQEIPLRLPPVLTAPLEQLRLYGFKLLDTAHIDACLSQIKDIQIRHLGYEEDLPF